MKPVFYLLPMLALVACTSSPRDKAIKSVKEFENAKQGNNVKWDKIEFGDLRKDTLKFEMTKQGEDLLDSMEELARKTKDLTAQLQISNTDASLLIVEGRSAAAHRKLAEGDSLGKLANALIEKQKELQARYDKARDNFGPFVQYKIGWHDNLVGLVQGQYFIDSTTFAVLYRQTEEGQYYEPAK